MDELDIKIDGIITVPANLTHKQFIHEFILLIESKGWYFGGVFYEIVEFGDMHPIIPVDHRHLIIDFADGNAQLAGSTALADGVHGIEIGQPQIDIPG